MLETVWTVARFWIGRELEAARRVNGETRAFCPVHRRRFVLHNTKHEILTPVLPGNVFIEMDLGFHGYRYHEVAALSGFLGFIGGGLSPQHVETKEINALLVGMRGRLPGAAVHDDADWEIELEELQPETAKLSRGDLVRLPVEDGSGRRPVGVVQYLQGTSTAWVSCNWLFDRDHTMPVAIDALERVEVTSKTQRRTLMTLEPIRAVAAA